MLTAPIVRADWSTNTDRARAHRRRRGTPFLPALPSWIPLRLVENRTFPGGVVLLLRREAKRATDRTPRHGQLEHRQPDSGTSRRSAASDLTPTRRPMQLRVPPGWPRRRPSDSEPHGRAPPVGIRRWDPRVRQHRGTTARDG